MERRGHLCYYMAGLEYITPAPIHQLYLRQHLLFLLPDIQFHMQWRIQDLGGWGGGGGTMVGEAIGGAE